MLVLYSDMSAQLFNMIEGADWYEEFLDKDLLAYVKKRWSNTNTRGKMRPLIIIITLIQY